MEEENVYCHKGHEMRVMTAPLLKYFTLQCYTCARSSSESGESALYYACIDCNKKCLGLPKQIDHPMHPEHPLVFLTKPSYESKASKCQVCKNMCENFLYQCSSCMFEIDILCAFIENEDITISTHQHSLRFIQRQAVFQFKCDACGFEDWCKESYICPKPSCGFWIHKKCGSLPETFQHPSHCHPLLLAISVPIHYLKYKFACEICCADLGSNTWIYYCQRCKYFIHLNCRIKKDSDARNLYAYAPEYEMIRQLKTIVLLGKPSWEPKKLIESTQQLAEMKVDSHKHFLVLNSSVLSHLGEDEIACDACIEPISSPYYKCGQQCNYFIHATCAALAKHKFISDTQCRTIELELCFPKSPLEVVKCSACNSFCNGYSYKCTINGRTFSLDIKCLIFYLESDMVHIGCKHYLRNNGYSEEITCTCCGESMMGQYFHCENERFKLGYECVVLPTCVNYRWDKHPLILCFPPHIRDTDEGDEFFCEVCEEEIHPKHWMYRCTKCDQNFHPRCIPTLGESRNIKFGKTVSIRSHPHQLTLVPQAKLTSCCHTCQKSLYWSRAFKCADCGFCLCANCIPKEELVVDLSD